MVVQRVVLVATQEDEVENAIGRQRCVHVRGIFVCVKAGKQLLGGSIAKLLSRVGNSCRQNICVQGARFLFLPS